MNLEPAMPDQVAKRIGRTEREAADARLREALREDVLTIGEYDERLGLVLAARTQSDLDVIVADLPAPAAVAQELPVPECSEVTATMGREEQRGRWRPGRPLKVRANMGTAVVDLREAVTPDGRFDIDAQALMGNIEVVVADDALVEVTGTAVMGEKKNTATVPTTAGGPHVRVHANVVMGSLEVRNANRRERKGKRGTKLVPARATAGANPWVGRAIGAAILAVLALGPGRAVLSADAVALFGSQVYEPTLEQLSGDEDVDVLSMFGSVEVVIPQGADARLDVIPLFGSAECDGDACAGPEGAPEVVVDGAVLFGSVEVTRSP